MEMQISKAARNGEEKQSKQIKLTLPNNKLAKYVHFIMLPKIVHFIKKRLEIMKANKEKYQEVEARRCSLCGGINHQNRQCDLRKEAKEYYTQRNFS